MINREKKSRGKIYDSLVVGGGAAGIFGAISTAENLPDGNSNIVVVEKSGNLLSKVRISGGGRCNVTNACFEPRELINNYPRGGKELLGPFHKFQPVHTIQWFENRGVELKTEPDGRMFPTTNRSQTITDCLLSRARQLEIEFLLSSGARAIECVPVQHMHFVVHLTNGTSLRARNVLLAPGGGTKSAYDIAHQMGHEIIAPVPSLFSFEIGDARLELLAGISIQDVHLQLPAVRKRSSMQTRGPILVTHNGLSGPAVLKLSAWAARELAECNYKTTIQVNWLPDYTVETFYNFLRLYRETAPPTQSVETCPNRYLPQRLWRRFTQVTLGFSNGQTLQHPQLTWKNAGNAFLKSLSAEIIQCHLEMRSRNINKDEFVTAGGVSLKGINFQTMESKILPGLYFAGEYLDIDGLTGGFNFQAAWTTGWLAGKAIAAKIRSE